ncbi:MAG: HlyD family secretion protein [Prevotellaceae bacterium]|jgi:HlyD family secretion protein|nr:HlyD family secretion protein [Prevotellaceae bacterium]
MPLFPPEIIDNSTESLFVKRSVRSKAIYLLVVFAVAAAIAALPFIYVQVSTQARGIIRTPSENNQLQTTVYGEVTEVRISENAEVASGDTLLVLNTQAIQEQISRKEEKIIENSRFIADINQLLSRKTHRLETAQYSAEKRYFRAAVNEQQTSINYLHQEYQTSKTLYGKHVIAQAEYLQQKNAYDAAVSQMANIKEQFRNRWEAEKTNYEIENRELESSIKQLEEEKTKYVLKAPASGAVIQFSGIRKGSFIAPGQTIAQISTNDDLLAECYVSPVDIGYIKEKQQVAFQLDAFNYNQWGLAHGRITEISKDVVLVNDQPVFRVRCSLDTKFLQLKNGYKGSLKKGMTLTGRFYLTERSLWQLLFDKVDNWINPKLKEKEQ